MTLLKAFDQDNFDLVAPEIEKFRAEVAPVCMSYQLLNFTQQQVVETGTTMMRQVLDLCPQQYPQEPFSCLTQIVSDVQRRLVLKFIPYQLGSGILANVSTKSD